MNNHKSYTGYTASLIIGLAIFFTGWAFKRYDNLSYEVGVPIISVGLVIIAITAIVLLTRKD